MTDLTSGGDGRIARANRPEPIPILSVTGPGGSSVPSTPGTPSHGLGFREAIRNSSPASKIREKLESLGQSKLRADDGGQNNSMSDRMFAMLFQQIMPPDEDEHDSKDHRSRKYVDRPGFSPVVMGNNFRRFNQRIGVAFIFQNRMIRLFSWRDPTHTLSFLAIYSFVCLDPALLAAIPPAVCLFFIMVPAFLARHPPPPSSLPTELYPLAGPPIAPPHRIKPAPELSKDFFRNARDLQNSMEDFSRAHDAIVAFIAPVTNFSNEALSSTVFLILTVSTCALFVGSAVIPWRAIFLAGGWVAICSGHPYIQKLLQANNAESRLEQSEQSARSWIEGFSATDNILSSAPETREVEVFELQHREMHLVNSEYESFLFSPSPYTPLSPSRIAGDRPRGSRFFEDVQPPQGWTWYDKKWSLDLLSREWVEERCITGVEVEIAGERWVTDIQYEEHRDEDSELFGGPRALQNTNSRPKDRQAGTWGQGSSSGRKGEWRRRRWVRTVQRQIVKDEGDS